MQEFAIGVENHSSWMRWALWGLLVSVIMAWVERSRGRTRPARDAHRLQHPPSTLIIGIAGFLFFAAIAVVSNVYANATTHWWTTAIFVGFALLALPVLGDYFAARHEVSEEGLRYGRLLGAGDYMRQRSTAFRSSDGRSATVVMKPPEFPLQAGRPAIGLPRLVAIVRL